MDGRFLCICKKVCKGKKGLSKHFRTNRPCEEAYNQQRHREESQMVDEDAASPTKVANSSTPPPPCPATGPTELEKLEKLSDMIFNFEEAGREAREEQAADDEGMIINDSQEDSFPLDEDEGFGGPDEDEGFGGPDLDNLCGLDFGDNFAYNQEAKRAIAGLVDANHWDSLQKSRKGIMILYKENMKSLSPLMNK